MKKTIDIVPRLAKLRTQVQRVWGDIGKNLLDMC